MVSTIKLKITNEIPNISRIISKFAIYDYNITKRKNYVILQVTMPSRAGINELVRRLSSKKNRPSTCIEELAAKEGALNVE